MAIEPASERRNARPEDAGQETPEEIGSTAGKTHERVLRETLGDARPDVARRAIARGVVRE